ncbi:MAG: carboxypeptidase regulatory-like domain-containing protein, partial [Planctomycetes bacterium]|nr:carboxypeptidase regulatory-like domain-containing protein [Planctomycetota bacterium]
TVPVTVQLIGYRANSVSPQPTGASRLAGLGALVRAERHNGEGMARTAWDVRATADPSGKVTVALEPGSYTIRVEAPGYFPYVMGEQAPIVVSHGNSYSFQATLRLCARVAGVVTDGARNVAGARVVVEPSDERDRTDAARTVETVTDAGGRFEVNGLEGNLHLRLRVAAEGCLPVEQALEQPVNGAAERKVTVRPAHGIDGVVTDERDGKPVAGARAYLLPSGSPVTAETLAKCSSHTTTDAAGAFKFDLLPAGRYRLQVVHDEYLAPKPLLEDDVTLAGGKRRLVTVRMPPGAEIRGRVIEAGRDPAAPERAVGGAVVEAAFADGRPTTELFNVAARKRATGDDGAFLLRGLLPYRTYRLTVSKPGYATASLPDLDARTGDALTVRLVRNGRIAGAVLLAAGAPAPGEFTARLLQPDGGTVRRRVEKARKNPRGGNDPAAHVGDYEWPDVAPGAYVLAFDAPGLAAARLPVTLDPGQERRVDVTLDRGGVIVGEVVDALTGNRVRGARVFLDPIMKPGEPVRAERSVTSMLNFSFDLVSHGAHALLVSHPSYADEFFGGVLLTADAPQRQITVKLRQGGVVTGVVMGLYGRRLPGVRVALSGPNSFRRMADTGPDGAFRFAWLPPGDGYRLRVDAESSANREPILARMAPTAAFAVADGETVAREFGARFSSLRLTARVFSRGEPTAAGVALYHVTPFGLLEKREFAENGVARFTGLSEGRYLARVKELSRKITLLLPAGDADAELDAGAVAPAEAAEPTLRFDLPDGAIVGRVFDRATGEPLAGARVRHQLARPSRASLLERIMEWYPDETTTDELGRFNIGYLPDGEYLLAASAPGRGMEAAVVVVNGGGCAFAPALELGQECGATVRVVDAAGKPVPGAEVLVSGPRGRMNFGRHFITGPDGSALARGLGAGVYQFTAQVEGCLPARAAPAALRGGPQPAAVQVTVRPAPGGTAEIAVEDPDGRPLPGAFVSLQRRGDTTPLTPEITQAMLRGGRFPDYFTDRDGLYILSGIEPGEYLLEIVHADHPPATCAIAFTPGKRHPVRVGR